MHDTEPKDFDSKDNELIEKIMSGEPDAVVELYNAYFDRIYSLVSHQVARDHDAVQDIVQETFLAALKSIGKFRGRSKVYTWLYSIANRKVADFYRRQKRRAKHETESLKNHATEPSPTETVKSEETKQAIQKVMSSLPLHYQQVLLLKYVEEMPVSEICWVMGRSPKSVEGLLSRARRALRNKLTTQNEG